MNDILARRMGAAAGRKPSEERVEGALGLSEEEVAQATPEQTEALRRLAERMAEKEREVAPASTPDAEGAPPVPQWPAPEPHVPAEPAGEASATFAPAPVPVPAPAPVTPPVAAAAPAFDQTMLAMPAELDPLPELPPETNLQPEPPAAWAAAAAAMPSVEPAPVPAPFEPVHAVPAAPAPVESEPASAPTPASAVGVDPMADPRLPAGALMSFFPRDRTEEAPRQFDPNAPRNRSAGVVIACSGSRASVAASTECYDTVTGEQWAVGRLLTIQAGTNRIVALTERIETNVETFDAESDANSMIVHVELQGEVQDREDGTAKFVKGITAYPAIGSVCHQIRAADLGAIYASTGSSTAEIGTLSQDASVPAFVEVRDMIAKHFAVLGSTGCGKSSSVSLLLHASQQIMPDLRVMILDPHNEYSCAFPNSTTITAETLDLPFWIFQLEEYVECLFRGKPIVQEEVDCLREMIPAAKVKFRKEVGAGSLRQDTAVNSITADSPLPYRMSDLLGVIDEELGLLDSKVDKAVLKSLQHRIQSHCNDPRFAFMFRHRTIEDVAGQVIGDLFALHPHSTGLTTILQMAGMPAEVVNAVASVLCRLAFELAIAARGGMKVLVVCEEAHRYVPADAAAAFGPTRRAIARIAKEGRKYGCFMAIVSQRPAELDPTILSQCCTVFSLRLANSADQDIIKKSISTGSASAIEFLSSIGNRECIAFGEGFQTPMRMKFATLPVQWLPGQDSDVFGEMGGGQDRLELNATLAAWRGGGH